MKLYDHIIKGIFRSRPNRFIGEVEINGQVEQCHIKNTGRCKELLVPGAIVYANHSNKPERVTKYELVAVWKDERLINMDSQAPNKVFLEYLQSGQYIDGITYIKPEAKHGDSRFDFYVEANNAKANITVPSQAPNLNNHTDEPRKILIEVKGVTLENDSVALFPDAPTERGVKHLHELTHWVYEGYEAHVVFVIKMHGVQHFSPNIVIHPAFGTALSAAIKAGVKASAFDCIVEPDSLSINSMVPIRL